jgi:electron transport complex protein RnfB
MSDFSPRKKLPSQLAVIDADRCTGCAACQEVCPVDCIERIEQFRDAPGLQAWCEIDWDRCIGCRLCILVPTKKSDPYNLLVCPWEAIRMVRPEDLVDEVDRMGGPAEYASANRGRLREAAARQLELASGG